MKLEGRSTDTVSQGCLNLRDVSSQKIDFTCVPFKVLQEYFTKQNRDLPPFLHLSFSLLPEYCISRSTWTTLKIVEFRTNSSDWSFILWQSYVVYFLPSVFHRPDICWVFRLTVNYKRLDLKKLNVTLVEEPYMSRTQKRNQGCLETILNITRLVTLRTRFFFFNWHWHTRFYVTCTWSYNCFVVDVFDSNVEIRVE